MLAMTQYLCARDKGLDYSYLQCFHMWGGAAKMGMPMQWVSILTEEPQIRKLQFFWRALRKPVQSLPYKEILSI